MLWVMRQLGINDQMDIDDNDDDLPTVQDGFVAAINRWFTFQRPTIVNSKAILRVFLHEFAPNHFDWMDQYLDAETFFEVLLPNPTRGEPGCPAADFMQPTFQEFVTATACPCCGRPAFQSRGSTPEKKPLTQVSVPQLSLSSEVERMFHTVEQWMVCALRTCPTCGAENGPDGTPKPCTGKYKRDTWIRLHTPSNVVVINIARKTFNRDLGRMIKNTDNIQLGGNLRMPLVTGGVQEYTFMAAIEHIGKF